MMCHESFFATQTLKLTGTSGGVLGHIAHVGNLLEALLALHLGGTLTVLGLLLDLSPLDVGIVELVTKAAVVGTGILFLGARLVVLDGLRGAEGVWVAVVEESRSLNVMIGCVWKVRFRRGQAREALNVIW